MNNDLIRSKLFPLIDELMRQEDLLVRCLEAERDALLLADLTLIQETSATKQQILESISSVEQKRVQLLGKITMRELILDRDNAISGETRGLLEDKWEALRTKVALAVEKNQSNQQLLSASMKHIENMKRNILGETIPKSQTYSSSGGRVAGSNQQGARRISKEV